MEHKALEALEVKEEARGTATAVFSRFGGPPDSDGDITLPGAFRDGTVVAVSPYNHSSAISGALPVGKATIRVKADRAEADVQFFLGTIAGREAFETVKELGSLVQWSYAYDVTDEEPGTWKGRRVRILKGLDPYEVSPVLRGAGRQTLTVAGSVKCDGCAPRKHDAAGLRAELLAIKARHLPSDDHLRAQTRAIRDRLQLCAIKEHLAEQTRRWWSECAAPPVPVERAAWAMLKLCADDLGVDLPLLRWFGPETSAEADYVKAHGERDWPHFSTDVSVRGAWQHWSRTVWVAKGLPFELMLATIAHEVGHAAGYDEPTTQVYEKRWADGLQGLN